MSDVIRDGRGLLVTTQSPECVRCLDLWLDTFLGYKLLTPAYPLLAVQSDPKCALAQAWAAVYALFVEKSDSWDTCMKHSDLAKNYVRFATEREKLFVRSISSWLSGKIREGIAILHQIASQWPRDLGAIKLAQLHYFNLGDSEGIYKIGNQVLKDNQDSHYILGMVAFGAVECKKYKEAERLGREGVLRAKNSRDPWACHAVAHVMDMQGRIEEGISWMEKLAPTWEDCHSFMYTHNWWHVALFHLDMEHQETVLKLYDTRVWGRVKECSQDQIGAASLLWRCDLRKIPVAERWLEVGDYISHRTKEHAMAFLDLHYIYALAKSGKKERVDEMIQSMAENATYMEKQKDVCIPMARALVAHANGQFDKAYVQMAPVFDRIREIGGSDAQRDIFQQTYLDTLMHCGRYEEALPLCEERATRRGVLCNYRDLSACYLGLDRKEDHDRIQKLVLKLNPIKV